MTQEHTEAPVEGFPPALRMLEAMLFASAEPLTTNAIRERLPKDADVGGMLMELQKTYAERGVVLMDLDGSWAFRTATGLAEALEVSRDVKRKLSRAAMETLSIVAYHQPVTRTEIENIRGIITHKGTLDVLMECGWVRPGRRRETPGRPLTWVTTTAFMDHFGLETLNDLPGLDELKASGLLDRRPAIDTLADTGDLFMGEDDADDGEDDDQYDDEDEDESDEETVSVAAKTEAAAAKSEDEESEDEESEDEESDDEESEDEESDDEESEDDDFGDDEDDEEGDE